MPDPNYWVMDAEDFVLKGRDTEQPVYGIVGDAEGGFIAYAVSKDDANLVANALNQLIDPS